ncbi:L,D-transpeptidase Cds6 family protein [Undibacterium luofuense]|uniref:L,D-transpeptidase Cds6 family protein n=1 Tax=Undibacterium luofuense TaxID=2828733 RepID=UPI0030EBD717
MKLRNLFLLSAVSSSLLFSGLSYADDATDISRLLRTGQTAEALQRVEAGLASKPKDAQLRFLKGLILTEQNKNGDAIAVFTKLTDDYPELPEPYNNLAVLYAAAGQYDKARAALEMAIRTNPTYGTAHENLGDVYAKLASQSYDKALQLDSNNATAKLKLTMVRNLVGNTSGGTNPKTAANSAPAIASAPKPAPVKIEPEPVKASDPAKAKPAPEPVKAAEAPKVKPAPAVTPDKDEDEVMRAVENWAKAWSTQDTSAYLNHYAKDFQTPKGESRKAWADERRSRIEGKGRISVKIESAKVSVDGSSATVSFRQIYTSDKLTANSRKTLVLTRQDGKWLIKQEKAGG